MAWSGGTYTKGNNGTGGWVGDASLGIGIEAGRHDTQDNDFATGINQCLNKDGSNSCTGDLNLGGNKPVNLAAGTAAAPAICAGGDVNTGIYSVAADTWAVATNGVERLRIGSTGQVAIRQNTVSYQLEQYSTDTAAPAINLCKSKSATVGTQTIVANNDDLGNIYFFGSNGTSFTLSAAISAAIDGVPGVSNDMPSRLVFATTPDGAGSPSERMRIDNTGKIGIGDPPNSISQLYVRSATSSRAAVRFYQDVATDLATPAIYLDKKDNNSTTSNVFLQATINSQVNGQGQINANGAGQLAFGAFSDARLKENISELPGQLTNFLSLRPVEFDYKDGSGHQSGFIAQEVQQVYPDFVATGRNDMLTLSSLGKWEARLVKAIQELNAKVEALEARVAELEAA